MFSINKYQKLIFLPLVFLLSGCDLWENISNPNQRAMISIANSDSTVLMLGSLGRKTWVAEVDESGAFNLLEERLFDRGRQEGWGVYSDQDGIVVINSWYTASFKYSGELNWLTENAGHSISRSSQGEYYNTGEYFINVLSAQGAFLKRIDVESQPGSGIIPEVDTLAILKTQSLEYRTLPGDSIFTIPVSTHPDTILECQRLQFADSRTSYVLGVHKGDYRIKDVFVKKLDNTGAVLWTSFISNDNLLDVTASTLDASGNLYLGLGGDDFIDPHEGEIIRLDEAGQILWRAYLAGSLTRNNPTGMTVLRNNTLVVSGFTREAPPGHGITEYGLMAGYDVHGAVLWTHQFVRDELMK